jgi:galactokinase/mevalonate kinase-like predicted kinase
VHTFREDYFACQKVSDKANKMKSEFQKIKHTAIKMK